MSSLFFLPLLLLQQAAIPGSYSSDINEIERNVNAQCVNGDPHDLPGWCADMRAKIAQYRELTGRSPTPVGGSEPLRTAPPMPQPTTAPKRPSTVLPPLREGYGRTDERNWYQSNCADLAVDVGSAIEKACRSTLAAMPSNKQILADALNRWETNVGSQIPDPPAHPTPTPPPQSQWDQFKEQAALIAEKVYNDPNANAAFSNASTASGAGLWGGWNNLVHNLPEPAIGTATGAATAVGGVVVETGKAALDPGVASGACEIMLNTGKNHPAERITQDGEISGDLHRKCPKPPE